MANPRRMWSILCHVHLLYRCGRILWVRQNRYMGRDLGTGLYDGGKGLRNFELRSVLIPLLYDLHEPLQVHDD